MKGRSIQGQAVRVETSIQRLGQLPVDVCVRRRGAGCDGRDIEEALQGKVLLHGGTPPKDMTWRVLPM